MRRKKSRVRANIRRLVPVCINAKRNGTDFHEHNSSFKDVSVIIGIENLILIRNKTLME